MGRNQYPRKEVDLSSIVAPMNTLLLVYVLMINLFTFAFRGRDKRQASQKKRRISENTLLGLVILGGGIGALLGQHLFRHKTIKGAFLRKFYLIILCWFVLGIFLWLS